MKAKIQPKISDRIEFAKRLAAASEEDTLRGVPFMGVRAMLERHLGSATADDLCERAGLPREFALLSKYPIRAFLEFEKSAADMLGDKLGGYDQAVFECGAAAVEVFFATLAGRTMKALAGDNPHRLLGSVPNGYELLTNYGRRAYRKTGPRSGVFTFGGELLGPVHSCGIFDAALRELHGANARFELVERTALDFDFYLEW